MSHPTHCLGKTPARRGAISFKLRDFLAGTAKVYPPDFGHEETIAQNAWGMNGNDRWGVCVVAGGEHETKLWNKIVGKDVNFTLADVSSDFTAITGLPVGPENGADMQQAASYRRRTGLRDSNGQRHQIGAYLELSPGNMTELLTAAYLFGAVGIGVAMYQSAIDDFTHHRSWGTSRNSGFLGYHYVPVVALRTNLVVVTWGRTQAMRPSWLINCDEAAVYLSQEDLDGAGRSPEGFDMATLRAKLAALTA